MTELIEYIAKALVDRPDQVSLRVVDVEGGRVFELKVAPEDVGKIIGRDGRTVNALRTLMAAVATRTGEKAKLEILDDRRNAAGLALAPSPVAPPSAS